MYKIGVIGDRESVMCFMSVGFGVYETDDVNKAIMLLEKMADEDYAVIYITETLAEKMSDKISEYRSRPIPAVITIPAKCGTTGYGLNSIKSSVERAIGADILFKE